MRRLRSSLLYIAGATLGVATMAAIAGQWLPPGVIAVAFALFFILVLPRRPRLVAAFCAGAALAVALGFLVFMSSDWDRCADEVGGELVEVTCGEAPPTR